MPERDSSSILDTILRAVAQRMLGSLNRYAEQIMKRLLRVAGLWVAGLALALLGLVFLAVGAVKWLALLVPSWLAWLLVGIVVFLVGLVLMLVTFVASRS